MKKNVFGRKFKRDKNERTALFKTLMSSLILRDSIQTTEAKAKAIKPEIERLVSKAKKLEKGSEAVLRKSLSKEAFDKIIKEVGPRFAKRDGGYTRIIKLGEKFGDNAPLVLIEWVEKEEIIVPVKEDKKASKAKPKVKEEKAKKEVKKAKPTKKISPTLKKVSKSK